MLSRKHDTSGRFLLVNSLKEQKREDDTQRVGKALLENGKMAKWKALLENGKLACWKMAVRNWVERQSSFCEIRVN